MSQLPCRRVRLSFFFYLKNKLFVERNCFPFSSLSLLSLLDVFFARSNDFIAQESVRYLGTALPLTVEIDENIITINTRVVEISIVPVNFDCNAIEKLVSRILKIFETQRDTVPLVENGSLGSFFFSTNLYGTHR